MFSRKLNRGVINKTNTVYEEMSWFNLLCYGNLLICFLIAFVLCVFARHLLWPWGTIASVLVPIAAFFTMSSQYHYYALYFPMSAMQDRLELPIHAIHVPNFVQNTKLSHALERHASDSLYGISILVMPKGSGKSVELIHFAANYQKRHKGHNNKVLYHAYEKGDARRSSGLWFRRALGIHDGTVTPLQELWTELPATRIIIILDGLDAFMEEEEDESEWQSMFVSLATHAANSRKVKIFIPLADVARAELALELNGRRKFRLLGDPKTFRWTPQMIQDYFDSDSGGCPGDHHRGEQVQKFYFSQILSAAVGVVGDLELLLLSLLLLRHCPASKIGPPKRLQDEMRNHAWTTAHDRLEKFLAYS